MRRYIPVLLALLAAPAAGQTYRWVDDDGVVNYGTKPPPGRAAQRVDTRPANTIDTAPVPRPAPPVARRAVSPPPPRAAPAVRGMDFDTYIRLERGMSEGELVRRAGRPDYIALDDLGDLVRSFYYYPTTSDPFTTVVTVRGGRIDHIERTKKH